MQRRHYIIALGIVAVIALGFAGMKGLSTLAPDPQTRPPQEIKRYVQTQEVKYKTINTTTESTGRVASQHFVDLSSEVPGKILEGNIPLKKGQQFRKGQLLVRIFSQEAEFALKARKSRFLNSVAALLPDFKIDYPESYEAWYDFFENTNIEKPIPPLPEFKSSQEKIYLSGRNILSDYYAIKSEEVRLSKYKLYAPFTGSFSDVFFEVGTVANPGAKIARMIRTDKLELEVPVEAYDARFIKKGDPVKIISDKDNTLLKGSVERVSDFVNPQTQSVAVFVSIHNNKNIPVYQGEYMRAVFSDIVIEDAMLINRNAVSNHNEVFTVKNGLLRKEKINVIKTNQENLVFNGLPEGTVLVTEPPANARENTKVYLLTEAQKQTQNNSISE